MSLRILVYILLLGLLSFLMTYFIKQHLLKRRILSYPNERSLHNVPTPSGGGLAIVVSWYIGLAVLYFSGIVEDNLFYALLCGVLLAIISFIDDISGLPVILRLAVQFITAIGAFWFLGGLRPLIISGLDFDYSFLVYPLSVIGIVWFINLFNFMDGVDGFASTQAIIISLVLYFFTGNLTTLIIVASVSGFLYWNWPRAKIFMGDVGSTQLGYILVILGIYFHNIKEFSILNWIMLASPFWFDATLTLYRRWKNGEKIIEGHRKHAYQRIILAGFTHKKVIISLLVINLVNISLILIYREIKVLQIPLFILTLGFYYLITRYVDHRVPFKDS